MNIKCSLIKLGDKWCSANTQKYAWVTGLSAHFIRPLPRLRQTGLSAHFIRRLPRWAPYPKPFKQTLRVRLAFLLLVCLRKQAFDTALKYKRLRREEGIRTLDTLPYTHFPGVLLQPLGHLTVTSLSAFRQSF